MLTLLQSNSAEHFNAPVSCIKLCHSFNEGITQIISSKVKSIDIVKLLRQLHQKKGVQKLQTYSGNCI